ncbi:metallophosphoesterase [Salinigranum sp.]|uniref:metallophosphoesterase n=1 Tax=Salinigranum sp. TaxID=1966351 RepID=UPI003565872F
MFDVAFADRAVFLPRADVLVVADLHVGRAAASDVEVPLGERADLTERLDAVLDRFSPGRVVVAGDVLHEFGRVSHRAAETLDTLDATCRAAGAELVLVTGNHDGMLETVWDGERHDGYRVDDGDRTVLVCHGHEEPSEEADRYVVGHDHPTITIEGQRRPCFLAGEAVYHGSDVLMLPAFSRVASGVEINGMRARDFQSPLVTDADALRPVVWDPGGEDALTFPPLGRFRKLL